MKLNSILLVSLLMVAALFAGCIGDDETGVVPTPTPESTPEPTPTVTLEPTPTETLEPAVTPVTREPETQIVWLESYAFSPRNPTIHVGDTLNWINDQTPKTDFKLVSEERLWENRTIMYGGKFKYIFNVSGNYTYYCPGYPMRGTVTVVK